MIELGVLGPLSLLVDDDPVQLGPSLSVLALALACARGKLVPAIRLGEMLAEAGGNPTATATVRSHVSHLRKALRDNQERGREAKVLISGRAGKTVAYALRPEAVGTDAERFDRRIEAGQAELREGNYRAAAEILRSALTLWRGDPLIDAAGRAFARDWTEHLEDRYRSALIARAAADVGSIRHADVAGELERMARRWPDEEPVRILLAIALYRSGRLAGAAAACRAAIESVHGQGLDSPRLHCLQHEVLAGTLPESGLPYMF